MVIIEKQTSVINMKKMTKSEAGKLGAKKTHKKRYEMINELSGLVEKNYLNYLQSWPTEHLKRLLDAYKK